MPDAVIVVGLWHANRDSPVLSALRSEGTDEHLVLSIGELLAVDEDAVGPESFRSHHERGRRPDGRRTSHREGKPIEAEV